MLSKPSTRHDPVELLVDASRDRLPELLPIKWARGSLRV